MATKKKITKEKEIIIRPFTIGTKVKIDESVFINVDEETPYYVMSGIPQLIYKENKNNLMTVKNVIKENNLYWYEVNECIYTFPENHLKIVND